MENILITIVLFGIVGLILLLPLGVGMAVGEMFKRNTPPSPPKDSEPYIDPLVRHWRESKKAKRKFRAQLKKELRDIKRS